MSILLSWIGGIVLTALISWVLVRLAVEFLPAIRLMAIPNARSCHTTSVPTGGGIVVVGLSLAVWLGWLPSVETPVLVVAGSAVVLMLVSGIDDWRPLSPIVRLVVQIAAVTACLTQLPADARIVADGMPFWIDRLLVGIGWVWFINLYNFMDGIDGMAGSQTAMVSLGVLAVSLVTVLPPDTLQLAAVLTAASAGYLVWNWHPARIIMGDVGSIPIGLLIGWLMIQLALAGQPLVALILPLYYVADATITLIRRIFAGKRFWEPHREHHYQQATVSGGLSHDQVVRRVIVVQAALIVAAMLSTTLPYWAIALAVFAVFALLASLDQVSSRGAEIGAKAELAPTATPSSSQWPTTATRT